MKKRSYKQQCALARALDMVGERWTFLIIRELLIAPKRYKTLVENLKGMGTNLLATRLKELEQSGVIERIAIPDSKLFAYQLTAFGRELEAPLLAIIRWGFKLPIGDEQQYLSKPEWDLVAMKAAFCPELAQGVATTVQFVTKDLAFKVVIDGRLLNIVLGEFECHNRIECELSTLMAIDAGEYTLQRAIARRIITITGCLEDIEQVLKCFSVR